MEQSTFDNLRDAGFAEKARFMAAYLLSTGWKMVVMAKHLAFSAEVKTLRLYVGKRGALRVGGTLADSCPANDALKDTAIEEGRGILCKKGIN